MSSPTEGASSNEARSNEKTVDAGSDRRSSASVVVANNESTVNSQKPAFMRNIEIDDPTHGTDSGFLSGSISSNLEEQKKEKDRSSGREEGNSKDNTESLHCHEKSEEVCVVDSGCIEEEDEYGEHQPIAQQHTQSPNQQKKIFDSSLINKNMKLKHDVDAHISERFCNLTLQNEPINDLNASSKVATIEPLATTTPKAIESNQLPAWEQCYQQNDEGDTYLHLACISGHENVVAALIRLAIHPCLLNIKNDFGQTPLHLAAQTKQRRILRMLLLAGAEPNIRDRHGNTPLHLACMSGDEQCVSALTVPFSASEINEAHRQYGYRSNDKLFSSLSYACLPPNLEIRNYNGEFCVHLAAEAGHLKILSILIQYGADINAREGKGGYTPLHISIERGNEELFNFLLDDCKQKLNLETTTFGRLTAYQFACILKRSQMQSILENHGAEPLAPPDSEYESSEDESDLEDSMTYEHFVDPGYFGNFKGGNAMAVM
ncbi:PREDICTED: NF-kappa-B inhibitor cactus [Rhagoletis zephyria]|uniref:NF-kappa-B inhibitor cactus n=1 Tax=Rhagoletis zephyria TaxID=28612 RepID=UPI0008113AFC|nr:PREDICTED: NF-kappa-B inhibitor cactus [Rhagoletis zephyria]XP_017475834.1 PREDICTED: NF-kappa-B inhibitor cactus [Rhagoletis zephyria]XP_017475835.1 PREDICTED: NF-kappa-B inhibitor cactus [Rhagoletis zephyria]XP_017475836.1 PREDICTED: NF-kappa-B inhibitor cactus [Rhagoletis zephyria]XP_017475837.1 PREDICTED: NF-kappa-B inhibitor cactus [Rhagoletis zephyria]